MHAAAVNPLDVANAAGRLGTPLGMKRLGTHARFVALPETWLSRKPEHLTMTEATASMTGAADVAVNMAAKWPSRRHPELA